MDMSLLRCSLFIVTVAVSVAIPSPRSPQFRGGGFSLDTESVGEVADAALEAGTPIQGNDHWTCHQVRRKQITDPDLPTSKQVAILIPFREQSGQERHRELSSLLDNLLAFTKQKASEGVSFKIFVVEQSPRGRFNRGALINVGFKLAEDIYGNDNTFTAIGQDCDFVPDERMIQWYAKSGEGPIHLASYVYCPGFGGVTIFRNDHFRAMNGYSHSMWGWGGEDDDAMDRWMSHPERIVIAPAGDEKFVDLGKSEDRNRDKHSYDNSMSVWKADNSRQAWITEGLVGLKYSVLSTVPHDDSTVHHVVVELGNAGDKSNQL
eukprot:TRINITY_DN83221_c0_g1_i1.p1 TRINITY_DN83221_c0_g1~~TRINITY_DN83221_c0_g1_i1.p1  ORF type:complete len:347 (+),score=20.74 TRINITY_DN83221_c0_g1_i1:82-1041(+)